MKNIKSVHQLWNSYSLFKNDGFNKRYLSLEKIGNALNGLSDFFSIENEGLSVNNSPIHSVSFGHGKTKILMWSQMHGNETTTTKAVFDLLKTFELSGQQGFLQKISSNCTIKIIPVLNPDGAKSYTRENANGVDLNRDAQDLSQPESRVLASIFNKFDPDFCFNLHDQRSIYSAGNKHHSAVISFLAPSFNPEKSVNNTRETSMKLIADVNECLQEHIPHQIGRYDDGFNANCVGDKFQSLKVPTLLFEAGHFPGDYQREETRKLIYIALMKALESISTNNYEQIDAEKYFEIPENKKLFFDIILRNITINKVVWDLAVQYKEKLNGQKIDFVPIIENIGDLSHFYGHKEFDGGKKILIINGSENIQKRVEVKSLKIGNEDILLNLNQY